MSRHLYGRRVIYTDELEINENNIISVLVDCKAVHEMNAADVNYLYRYFRGDQEIWKKQKDVRPEISHIVLENHAKEIVDFSTSFLVGEPVTYICTGDNTASESITRINNMMSYEGKADSDRTLVEWQNICGTAYRIVLPDEASSEDEAPFEMHVLEPAQTFVIYSSRMGHKPMAGVYYTIDRSKRRTYNVYTENRFFEITDGIITRNEPHALGMIPIIEYPGNNSRLGAFEPVITLLDAINDCQSSRQDGIDQFIQSLAVAVNCNFPEDTTANDIREAGMIVLKSVGENKADFKILSEQLDQIQTQTYKDDLYTSILKIVGMPIMGNGTSDSSNNGSTILRNGWQSAEARAKAMELSFKKSEKEMLKLLLRILRDSSDINIKVSDIDCKFTRRCYEDINSKANVLNLMLSNDKIEPRLAFVASGLFTDPEEAYQVSMKWYKQKQKEAKEQAALEAEKAKADAEAQSASNGSDDSADASASEVTHNVNNDHNDLNKKEKDEKSSSD